MAELWLPVAGYEGLYEVSNQGRVRSLPRNVKTHRGKGYRVSPGRILSPASSGCGYVEVELSKDGIRKKLLIHRLVASAFIDNPDGFPQVNHKDENKMNNCVENLEWCTAKYNANYGTGFLRAKPKMSEAKKKKVAKCENGVIIAIYSSIGEAAKSVCSDPGHIGKCCNKKQKTSAGYQWKYI